MSTSSPHPDLKTKLTKQSVIELSKTYKVFKWLGLREVVDVTKVFVEAFEERFEEEKVESDNEWSEFASGAI